MEATRSYELVSLDSGYQRADRGCVGIVLVARSKGSARWNQFAVAAFWDMQSTPGNRGAVRGHDHHHQDGQGPLFGGDSVSPHMAGCRDFHSVLAQDFRSESP